MKEMKTYSVEYKDRGGYGVGEEVEATDEHEAIMIVVRDLLEEDNYMNEIIDVRELVIHEQPLWKLENGTLLEQEHQDTLNDAMLNMVNENGMTLKQVWDKEIEEEKNK